MDRDLPKMDWRRRRAPAGAVLALAFCLGALAGAPRALAIDRYSADVRMVGSAITSATWEFDSEGDRREQQAAAGPPVQVVFHNNSPPGVAALRAQITIAVLGGVPAHWRDDLFDSGVRATPFIAAGESSVTRNPNGPNPHRLRPAVRFNYNTLLGHGVPNRPFFHDFREGGDGPQMPMRCRLLLRVNAWVDDGIGGGFRGGDTAELVVYASGSLRLGADPSRAFVAEGSIPVVHVYARPDLIIGPRPGAIDAEADDLRRDCACDEACIAGAVAAYNNSVDLRVAVGAGDFGVPLSMRLKADVPVAALSMPEALELDPELFATRGAGGELLQVEGGGAVVEVAAESPHAYELRFHHRAETGEPDPASGLYAPPGAPHATVRVENPDGAASIDRLRVTRTTDAGAEVSDYEYDPAARGWTLAGAAGARQEIAQTSTTTTPGGATCETETRTLCDAAGDTLERGADTYWIAPFGRVKIASVADPGGRALATTYAYYDDPATDGHQYGLLKYTQEPSGLWTCFAYDEYRRVVRRVRPAGDAPFPAAAYDGTQDAQLHVVSTSYDDFPAGAAPHVTVVETYLGAEVARRYTRHVADGQDEIVCQTPGAAHDAADNLVTKLRRYAGGESDGEPLSTAHPDGTLTHYSYATSPDGATRTTTIDRGAPDAGDPTGEAVIDGLRTVTTTNAQGTVIAFTASDIASGTVTDAFTATTDAHGRAATTTYLDGASTSVQYLGCCGATTSTTDRLGVTTTRTEDAAGTSISELRNGVLRTTTESATARPGGGRTLTVTRAPAGPDGQPTGPATVLSREEYDSAGLLVASYGPPRNALTDPDPADLSGRTLLEFDTAIDPANGHTLRTSIGADGATTVQEFYADGRLAKVSGSAVHPRRYQYGVAAPPASPPGSPAQFYTREIALDATGTDTAEWRETYVDLLGRETCTLTSAGAISRATYNTLGQLASRTDPDGVTALYAYDARGRLRDTAIDLDRDGAISYAGNDRITRVDRGFGQRGGKPTSITTTSLWTTVGDAATTATLATLEASTDGLDLWATDADNLTTHTHTDYPGAGASITTTSYPDGQLRTQTYSDGKITADTLLDASGGQVEATSYSYDQLGRLATVGDAHDGTSTYTYCADDLVHTITTPDPDGPGGPLVATATTYTYDAAGRRAGVLHPDGATDTYSYLPTGELHQASGTRRVASTTSYDHAGRIKTFAGGGAGAKTWHYAPDSGFLTSVQDAAGHGPTYTHTAAGRLATRTLARGTATTYRYDNAGELAAATHSDATPATSYRYDRTGNLASATRGPSTHTYTTTPSGRVLLETVSGGPLDGLQREPEYDTLLRPSGLHLALGAASVRQSIRYDAASRPAQLGAGADPATSPSASYTYHPGTAEPATVTFKDAAGTTRLTTTRSIDRLRRTTALASTSSGSADPVALSESYQYNAAGQRERTDFGDGGHWSYSYGALGQLASATRHVPGGAPLASQTYTYSHDAANNRLASARGGAATQTYTPDPLNQYTAVSADGTAWITGEADPAASVTVGGDPAARPGGGRHFEHLASTTNPIPAATLTEFEISATLGATTETATRRALVPPASNAPAYDADGNLAQDARWTYEWDAENQLAAIQTAPGVATSPAAPRLRVEFDHDHLARRIAKRTYAEIDGSFVLATDTLYLHGPGGTNILAEITNGELARTYLWGPDTAAAAGLLAITNYTNPSNPSNQSGEALFPAYDASGNLVALAAASDGEAAARYAYGPFGETAEISGRAAHLNPFRFSTQYRDAETGHYHYGARQYDPESGRWLGRDPAGHRGGANEYAFLGNDPVNQNDVGGLAPWRHFDLFGVPDLDLQDAVEAAEEAAADLAFYDRELDAELHSAGLSCEWAREIRATMIDKAAALGAATIRAANLANSYYADANPIGQRDAYAERLFQLKEYFADASQLDYARLGPMRNSLEMLGTSLTAQLNTSGDTRAFAGVAATASFALLDAAGAPGLSKFAIGAFKAAGRKAATLLPETAQILSEAARPIANKLRATASKATNTLAKQAGTASRGYAKVADKIKRRLAGNPPSSRAGMVVRQAGNAPIKGADDTVDVYRVFGGDARAQGFSWTTVDPRTVKNFRDGAGLPSGGASGATNTADFLVKGQAKTSDVIKSRSALPLDGNKGGLPELIIDPQNVNLDDFSVLKP